MIRKRTIFCAVIIAVLALASCPGGDGDVDTPQGAAPDITKKALNGQAVINTLWCEGAWQDPRSFMGYRLKESGTPFFDRYVMLYGGRIEYRDCPTNPREGDEHCQKVGLHLHHPSRQYRILEEAATYIKPIQDVGQKFLMALVPDGEGVAHGTLYSWPMQDVYDWETETGQPYPFGPAATQKFIDDIKEAVAKYHIDGIGFDDEYGNNGPQNLYVYPNDQNRYSNASARNAAWERGGKNMFRLCYDLKKQLGKDFILECYEIRYGTYMPERMRLAELDPAVIPDSAEDKWVYLRDVLDLSYQPMYGNWSTDSGSYHMPRRQFAPISVDMGSSSATTPLPPPTANGIDVQVQDLFDGKYGGIMYFSMSSRAGYKNSHERGGQFEDYFGGGWEPERYLSRISRVLYGEEVEYIGDDYQLPWN